VDVPAADGVVLGALSTTVERTKRGTITYAVTGIPAATATTTKAAITASRWRLKTEVPCFIRTNPSA